MKQLKRWLSFHRPSHDVVAQCGPSPWRAAAPLLSGVYTPDGHRVVGSWALNEAR